MNGILNTWSDISRSLMVFTEFCTCSYLYSKVQDFPKVKNVKLSVKIMQKLRYSVQHFKSSHTNFYLSARTVICQYKKFKKKSILDHK